MYTIKDGEETKITIEKGDRLLYTKSSKTVCFSKEGGETVYFCGTISTDKFTVDFIRSVNDFVTFSIFVGKLFSLQGKLIEQSENFCIFEFNKEIF